MMKKIVLGLFALFSIISCDNDDVNTEPTTINPTNLHGEWNLNRREIGGVLEDLEVCELQSTINFSTDNSFDVELFIGDVAEDCESASNIGIWEYLSEDKIEIQLNSQNSGSIYRVSFSNNFNTMVLIETFGDERLEEYVR